MIVIASGGRHVRDRDFVFWRLDRLHAIEPITAVYEGGAKGVDKFAGEWADSRKVARVTCVADWNNLGDAAGRARNKTMLAEAAQMAHKTGLTLKLASFPGGTGSAHMRRIARAAKVVTIDVGAELNLTQETLISNGKILDHESYPHPPS